MTQPMRITGRQLFWILVTMETGTMELLSLRPTIELAGQDAWMSMFVGGFIGLFMTWIVVKVCLLYPQKSLIEYIHLIVGTWFGRLIGLVYLGALVFEIGIILRQFSDFVHTALFDQTPLWVVILGLVTVMSYICVRGGIEGIARCAELIGPVAVLTVSGVKALNWPNYDIHFLLPVYADSGWWNILRGSLVTGTFFGQSNILLMLICFLAKPEKAMSVGLRAIGASTILMTLSITLVVGIFSPLVSARLNYPAFETTRFISVMDFVQNIDSLVVVVWIFAYFVHLSTGLFITSYGLGQWLHLQKWKWLVGANSIVAVVLALLPEGSNFATEVIVSSGWFLGLTYLQMLGLPLFLWLVAWTRGQTRISAQKAGG